MNSFLKFKMVQYAKLAVSAILIEDAGVLLGVIIAEQSAKQKTMAELNQILEELKLIMKNQRMKKEDKSE